MEKDYLTKKDAKEFVSKQYFTDTFNAFEKHVDSKIDRMEDRLSEKLSNRINDTYWKLIPIIIGGMALVNGVFYVAYSIR